MGETKVTVHSGPGRERNERVFEACLARHCPPHPSFLYLVITSWRRRQLKRRFLDAFPASFEVPIFTLPGLVGWLLRFDPRPVTPIGEVEKQALLLRLLGESADGTRKTEDARQRTEDGRPRTEDAKQFVPLAARYISHVKQQNIHDEEMLRLRYAKSEIEPGPLQRRLAALFGRYQRELGRRRLEDSEDRCARLYESLLTGSLDLNRQLPRVRELVVEGACPRPPLHAALLRMLIRGFPRVGISIDSETDIDLASLVGGLDVETRPVSELSTARTTRRDSQTREEEATSMGREIQQDLHSGSDLDPEAVAVVCSRPAEYMALLDEVFGERDIPFCRADGRVDVRAPWIATLRAYLELLRGDFIREQLFDFLKRLAGSPDAFSAEEVALLESAAMRVNVAGGFDRWTRRFPERLRRQDKKGAEEIGEGLIESFQKRMARLALDRSRPRPLAEWMVAVDSALPLLSQNSKGAPGTSIKSQQARTALADSFSRAADAWGSQAVDFESFRAILELTLDGLKTVFENPRRAVVVGTPEQLQQCRFRRVYWLGINEGSCPRPPQSHTFVDEVGRRDLGLPGWDEHLREEERLFSLLTRSAAEWVTLIRPLRDHSAVTQPSIFLEAFGFSEPAEPSRQVFAVSGGRIEKIQQAVRRGVEIERGRREGIRSPYQGWLESQRALSALRRSLGESRLSIKPTHLEEYVRCGFRFFVERVLDLRPKEPFRLDVSPRDRGVLLHRILFRFMDGLPAAGADQEPESWQAVARQRMAEILENEFASLAASGEAGDGLFLEDLRRKLARGLSDGSADILSDFIRRQWRRLQSRRVLALEQEAGPVTLGRVKGGNRGVLSVVLQGRLDRVERGPGGLSVVDYKTGLDQRRRVFNGWGFQLPLYSSLAEQSCQGQVIDAGFYQIRIPDRMRFHSIRAKWKGDAAAGFRRLRDYYEKKALEAAQSMYDGNFPTTLLGPSQAGCRTCRLARTCRFQAAAMQGNRARLPQLRGETLVEKGRWLDKDAGGGRTTPGSKGHV